MKIFLVTDTHFSHTELVEYGRPKNFERRIKKGLLNLKKIDLLIHLGDVCVGDDKKNNNWFNKLNCKKVLVRGNHDRKSNSFYMTNGWDFICDRFDLDMYGKRLSFSHKPLAWDGNFDMNIHGHMHDTVPDRHPQSAVKLTGYNKLLAMEYTNYQPIGLKRFIDL